MSPIIAEDIAAIAKGLGNDAQCFAGKTVLITGSAGFLGKYLIATFAYLNEHVLEQPCRVLALDNFITGSHHPDFNYRNNENIIEVWSDVSQAMPIREDLSFVIHAAGIASPVHYRQYPLETIEGAVTGTKNLLELSQHNKLEGFLFFSSSEIYGDPDPKAVPTPETYHGYVSSVGPRACYDESKRLGETICTIYQQRFGIPTRIVRPFNIFGPGMGFKDKRVIPMFTYKVLHDEDIPVHGTGEQTRTFCYITDGIVGFLKVLLKGKDGEAYNIGNEQNEISMANLAKAFVDSTKTKSKVALIEYPETYPAGEPMRRCPDLSKARTELTYEPKMDMYTGIKRFVDWARKDPSYAKSEA